jgi:N-acetylneuraminate synthase
MDKNDLKLFKNMLEKLNLISGSKEKKCIPEELISKKNARRSIVANCLINKGDIITREMITFKRPGTGIKPFEIDEILGKKASIEIAEDTILEQEMIAD